MTFNRTAVAVALFAMSTGVFADKEVTGGDNTNQQGQAQGQLQGQAQGQLQGQAQGQGQLQGQSQTGINANAQTNRQTNNQSVSVGYGVQDYSWQHSNSTSVATGGAGGTATASGGSANSTNTTSSSSQGGSVAASGNATNSGNNTGTSTVVVEGDQARARNPVSSATAPTVFVGNDQCLVPVAIGAQGVGFGLSFGVAVRDEICEVIKLSRQVETLVDRQAAVVFLRMHDKRVDEALKSIGR